MYPLMLACVQHDKDDKQQQKKTDNADFNWPAGHI